MRAFDRMRITVHADHRFRCKPITHSSPSRSLISVEPDHSVRAGVNVGYRAHCGSSIPEDTQVVVGELLHLGNDPLNSQHDSAIRLDAANVRLEAN